jgi:hypothetical protein
MIEGAIGNPFPRDTWRGGRMQPDSLLFDPITATIGAAGIGANLFSGIFRGREETAAANQLAGVAREAGNQVVNTTQGVNSNLNQTTGIANDTLLGAANRADTRVTDATTRANNLLNPYAETGAQANARLQAELAEGGQFNRNPTMADILIDPGYAFRQQQDEQAQNRLAAARGQIKSGGQARALSLFTQGNASQEFKNAFDRYRTTNAERFDRLFSASGRGQDAANRQGQNLIGGETYGADLGVNTAERVGSNLMRTAETTGSNTIGAETQRQNYFTDAASTQAQARVNRAGNIGNAVTGAVNAGSGAVQVGQMLRNPAGRVNYFPPPAATPPFVAGGRR